jgi:hypothetical protein
MRLRQSLVTNLAESTPPAALLVLMRARNLTAVLIDPHFRDQVK